MMLPVELRYAALRLALAQYHKALPDLEDAEWREIKGLVEQEDKIHRLILQAPQAAGVTVSAEALKKSVAEIRGRYPEESEFIADLARNGLELAVLENALGRELRVEAVLAQVRAEPVSDTEVEIFYHLHRERFAVPETRVARHILITINPKFPENTRDAARRRILDVAVKLRQRPARFAELAQKYSECPTAMHGGLLGRMRPGQLYPVLDRALFKLRENSLSEILESDLGFHVLTCDAIHPAEVLGLAQVAEKIRGKLQQRRNRQYQQTWLTGLRAAEEA